MWLKGRACTLIGVLLAVLAMPAISRAQVALTTVQDTVYAANGTPAQGTVVVSWSTFTTAAGDSIAAGTTSATIGAGGVLTIALAPNAGATPTGSYYTAMFHLSDGTTSRQTWVLPAASAGATPVKLATIQNNVLPTSVAMQTASKTYVDTAIAKAMATGATTGSSTGSGSALQTTGGTMTGPLVLAGDPVAPLQAADKSYVDTSVAQVAGGLSTKVSTAPAGAQTVVQPSGTQLQVNSLNGVLEASGFATGNGGNGIANALASVNCTNGCEVRASQTYPGTEGVPTGSIPTGGHVKDERGGSANEFFMNPLGSLATGYVASTFNQTTTVPAPQFAAAHPGTPGAEAFVMKLGQFAPAGGANFFPASHERVPYGKSTYGVLQLSGTYNTQGQHVQFNNLVNCFSVGDCLAGGQFIASAGGYRDEADEGTHPFDLQVREDTRVFQGACANGCTTGSTSLTVSATANSGTQGDGRFLINKNASKVISAGSITGSGGDEFSIVYFSGTKFPVSVFLSLTQAVNSQGSNLAPGTVTVPIATTPAVNGFATSTAALPSNSGVACVADISATGVFPNFETATYSVVDATHLQLNLNKSHLAGAVVAVGGLCGYGLEQTVDTVAGVRQVFPVVGSLSAGALYYASGNTNIVGYAANQNTSGYLNTSLPIASAVRKGNTVTLTTASNMTWDLNGLSLTITGVSDASFKGTFQVTTTGGNTITYADSGPDASSSGGSVGIVTGGFNLYPMAEVLSVYNAATGSVDGTMTLAPNTVAWAAGDPVEQPHYHQQLVDADTEFISQFVPKPIQYSSAGKQYEGTVGPGTRGWQITNAAPTSQYLGGGGTHQPPDDAYVAQGVWRNTFEMEAGTEALLRVHCSSLRGCSRWDSSYAVLSMDSHQGQDFLFYDPVGNSAMWSLGGTPFTFSPNGFSAPSVSTNTVTTSTLNATKLTGSIQASGGTSSFMGPNAVYGRALHVMPYAAGYQTGIDFDNPPGVTETQVCGSASYPGQTNRWQFTMGGDYSWLLYDTTGCRSVLQVQPAGTLVFMPGGSGNVSIGGSVTGSVPGVFNVGGSNQFFVDGNGNVSATGTVTAKTAIASGSASNTDMVGTLVVGAGSTSSAGYSFAGHYASAPVCMVQPQNTTPAVAQALAGYVAQVSTGALSVSVGTAPGTNVTFGYTCVARN